MAGLYRTGKSFFLNRVLLKQKSGFAVGNTTNACTKGIWIYSGILKGSYKGQEMSVLVADTEGLSSVEADENHDVRLFTLALLTCSHMIYNSKSTIDAGAIKQLYMSASLAKELKGKNGECLKEVDFEKLFPFFTWVVRDFQLDIEDENDQLISDDQYLEKAIEETKEEDSKET